MARLKRWLLRWLAPDLLARIELLEKRIAWLESRNGVEYRPIPPPLRSPITYTLERRQ